MPVKDVVTGAPFRQCVLVTGFGAFPGARHNPTLAILAGLERYRGRLARLGIGLHCVALPVVYDAVEPALRAAIGSARPDAILHLGLAGRRRWITLETRAVNRAGPLHPDAMRRRPAQVLAPGAPQIMRATWPAQRLRVALIPHGARLSIDAGDYVCNATLYRSLAAARAPRIGFLHVPRPKGRRPLARGRDPRPDLATMTDAVLAAILTVTRGPARRDRSGSAGLAQNPVGPTAPTQRFTLVGSRSSM